MTTNNLARIIIELRGFAEAHGLLEQAVAATLRQRPATHDDTAFMITNQALAEIGLGHPDRAEALLKRAEIAANLYKHRNRAPILVELFNLECERGAGAEGLALTARAAPVMASDYPGDAWRNCWLGVVRGECHGSIDIGYIQVERCRTRERGAAGFPLLRSASGGGNLVGSALHRIGELDTIGRRECR